MADHLPELFRTAGLAAVESHVQDEVVQRGESDFAERTALWSEVLETLGARILETGWLTQGQLQEAIACYAAWVRTDLETQTLSLRAVVGTRSS